MNFLIPIQDPVLIRFTTVNQSLTILTVVHQIFDTTTRGMGDSSPGIGIIQLQCVIMLPKQGLILHHALWGGGGWKAVLIWTIASLKSFFDTAVSLVRLHQRLLHDDNPQWMREFHPNCRPGRHLVLVEGYQVVPLRLPTRDLEGWAGLVSQGSSQIVSIPVWRLPKWSLSLIAFGKGFWVIVKILKDHPNPKGSSLLAGVTVATTVVRLPCGKLAIAS